MDTLVITTCTNKKRVCPPPKLRASSLAPAPLAELVDIWRRRISCVETRHRAADVYGGRSFREAEIAANAAGGPLWIVSAGVGLVSAEQAIPSYSLTFASGSSDYIGLAVQGAFEPSSWWSLLNPSEPSPIAQLVRRNSSSTVVLALSKSYAKLIERDLLTLGTNERRRLRFVGLSIVGALPEELREYVMGYDSRFDGPDSTIPGTRADFASRAARHFVTEIIRAKPDADAGAHKRAVSSALSGWRQPKAVERRTMSDSEIIEIIAKALERTSHRSGQALRYLRDVERIACEQGRFRRLFKQALEMRTA